MTAIGINEPSITVFRGWKDPGKHVWSPFVVKLEARLRFAGVRYGVDVGSPKTAPKGKIPYVEIDSKKIPAAAVAAAVDQSVPRDGRLQLSDSTLIIKTLSEWGVVPDINHGLSGPDRARDSALRALLEDKLYFYHTWERWILNYYTMRDHVFQALPYPARILVGLLVYRNTVATLHGQGTGRFSAEEIAGFRREIWEGINDMLVASRNTRSSAAAHGGSSDDQPFWVLGGDAPTEADASLFGFVVSVLVSTAAPDSREVVRGFPVVLDYARRIQLAYFPDYDSWVG